MALTSLPSRANFADFHNVCFSLSNCYLPNNQKKWRRRKVAKSLICKRLALWTHDFARSQEVENRDRERAANEQSQGKRVDAKSTSQKRKTPRGTWPCGVFQDDKERVFVEGSGGAGGI